MIKRYGLPYRGSKSAIAESICKFLPAGKRLVDLFGGGGAISHCASLSYKWDSVLYNELDSFMVDAFTRAVNGTFPPLRWISREEFFRLKGSDPMVAICFSFGFNREDYSYHKKIEKYKKAIFTAEYENDYGPLHALGIDIDGVSRVDLAKWWARHPGHIVRQEFGSSESFIGNEYDQRYFRIMSLQEIPSNRISITNDTYLNYSYEAGDVVYCDPPYEATDQGGYKGPSFDSEEFYSWVESRPYQVFFSSYEALKLNERFIKVWEEEKYVLSSGLGNLQKQIETIYSNKEYNKSLLPIQGELF